MRRRAALAAGSGLLLSLAFPSWLVPALHPWTGWLAWFALVPLLTAVADQVPRKAAVLGWIGGAVFFTSTLYWIACIRELGAAGIPVCLAFAAVLGAYWGGWGWLMGRVGTQGMVWLAAPAWIAQEWLRGVLWTGFPWTPLGSSQCGAAGIIPAARLCGISGVGLAVAIVNVGGWSLAARRPAGPAARRLAMAAVLLVLLLSALARRDAERSGSAARAIRVVALQGSFTEDEKWSLPVETMLHRYEAIAMEAAGEPAPPGVPTVMIWPETATASLIEVPGMLPFLTRLAARTRSIQLVGALQQTAPGRVANGAFAVSARGIEGAYRKTHLVPFGEYVPRWCRMLLPFLAPLTNQVVDLAPGETLAPVELPGGLRLGVLVCYEAIFPGLARGLVRRDADVLVNITNDAWYLKTASTYQHALGPIGRAVECGRWMVRAANTGFSVVVDPLGQVTAGPPLFTPGRVTALVRTAGGRTAYGRWGDWPLLGYGVVMLLCWRRLR